MNGSKIASSSQSFGTKKIAPIVVMPSRHEHSALRILSRPQKIIIALLSTAFVILLFDNWHGTLVGIITILTVIYFFDLVFNLSVIFKSSTAPTEIKISDEEIVARKVWPTYTIFCPLYKEAHILPQFIKAMTAMDYPKEKLEILLVLEQDDIKTVETAEQMELPDYFKIVIVPHSFPKTKPKACNHALELATGKYGVIYDAEDIPDPKQLKKAILAFEKVDPKTICLQSKLNYYNPHQNLLTKLFTLEYSLWFEVILTGLQTANGPIPLGGTSNHFRMEYLEKLKGWDPFNVTEDADLGIRISKEGYHTSIIDSVTMEEANSHLGNWFRQRSRWIKGYMQTYLVHMQAPFRFKSSKVRDVLMFQLIIGGKIVSSLINPLMWVMTIAYFMSRTTLGTFISSLYLQPVLYVGVFAFVIGNFAYAYMYMIGVAERKQWTLEKYGIFTPIYWLMISTAAYFALWELIAKPFHWHKTKHGLHLKTSALAS